MRKAGVAARLLQADRAAGRRRRGHTPSRHRDATSTISTDNQNSGDFTMPRQGEVLAAGHRSATATARRATRKRGTLTLSGNVTVHDSGSAPEVGEQAYGGNGPANLSCNTLDVDAKSKIYTADGNVHFSQGTRNGARRARRARPRQQQAAPGAQRQADRRRRPRMTAHNVDYNLATQGRRRRGEPDRHQAAGPVA